MKRIPGPEVFNRLHSKEVKEYELGLFRAHSAELQQVAAELDAKYKANLLAYRNKVLEPFGWTYDEALANQEAKW